MRVRVVAAQKRGGLQREPRERDEQRERAASTATSGSRSPWSTAARAGRRHGALFPRGARGTGGAFFRALAGLAAGGRLARAEAHVPRARAGGLSSSLAFGGGASRERSRAAVWSRHSRAKAEGASAPLDRAARARVSPPSLRVALARSSCPRQSQGSAHHQQHVLPRVFRTLDARGGGGGGGGGGGRGEGGAGGGALLHTAPRLSNTCAAAARQLHSPCQLHSSTLSLPRCCFTPASPLPRRSLAAASPLHTPPCLRLNPNNNPSGPARSRKGCPCSGSSATR